MINQCHLDEMSFDTFDLDIMLIRAAISVEIATEARVEEVKAEIRAMGETARRSIGQRVRWAKRLFPESE